MASSTISPLGVERNHYIGIDVGTASARACVMNEQGDIVDLASESIRLWEPQPAWYEQSTTDIWKAICICVQKVMNAINPASVKGMGFAATCSLAVFSTDTNEPVPVTGPDFKNDGDDRNVVLWLDHRPVEETKKINATKHKLLSHVGGRMYPEMETPKVLWLKNNMPQGLFARCKFFDLADALTHIATGNENSSFCSAVCKTDYVPVGIDGSIKGWQEDFLTQIGLQELAEENFSRIGGIDGSGQYFTAGDPVGTLCEKAAKDLGLPSGIAVGSGVIDAYAGWIGTVGARAALNGHAPGTLYTKDDISQAFTRLAAVAGTSTCHLAMSEQAVLVNGVWGPYRDVLIPGYWVSEGGQSATGELLRHVIETHPAQKSALAIADMFDEDIYEYLNSHLKALAKAKKSPASSVSWLGRHLFFYGDLFGNRSPIADADMRGSVVGLSSDKSIDSLALLYYGAMEFIALQTRQIVERMNGSGHVIGSIFMSGSLCQNDILMALIASACSMPVVIPQYANAAVVHGAAMLGVKAASARGGSKGEDLWSIMRRMSKPGKAVYPTEDAGELRLLAAKYKVFLQQCEQQQQWRSDVDEAVEGWGR